MICIYLEEEYAIVEYRDASGSWRRIRHNEELCLWLYFKIQRIAGEEVIHFGSAFREEWADSFDNGIGGPDQNFELVGNLSERIDKSKTIMLNGEQRSASWLFGSVLDRIQSLLPENLFVASEIPWRICFGPTWTVRARNEIVLEFKRKRLPAPVVCPEGRIYSHSFVKQGSFPILILHTMGRDLYCGILNQADNFEWRPPQMNWGVDPRISHLAKKLVKGLDQNARVLITLENIENEVRRHELRAVVEGWPTKLQRDGLLTVRTHFLRDQVSRIYNFDSASMNNESGNTWAYAVSGIIQDYIEKDGIRAVIFLGDSFNFPEAVVDIQRGVNGKDCHFYGESDVFNGTLEAMRTAKEDLPENRVQDRAHNSFSLLSLGQNGLIELNCQNTVIQLLVLGNGKYQIVRTSSSNIGVGTTVSIKDPILAAGKPLQMALQDGRIYTSRPLNSWVLSSTPKASETAGSGFEIKLLVASDDGPLTQLNLGMLRPGTKVRLVGKTMGKPDSVKILENFGDSRFQIIECNRVGLEPGVLVIAQDSQWELGQNLTFLAPNPSLNRELSKWKTRRISSIEILH